MVQREDDAGICETYLVLFWTVAKNKENGVRVGEAATTK
jgi:hypothetical protein